MRLKFFLFIFILSAIFPRPIFSLTCIDPCRYDSECDTNQYCYVPMPPACAVCKDKDSSAPTSPVAPASGNTSSSYSYPNPSPTALRPNPFQLVEEETNKAFSADKDQMTVGIAEGPDFTGLPKYVISSFYRFITPFLSPGQDGIGGPAPAPSSGPVPPGGQWLQWPTHNVHFVFQCFRDTRNSGTHAGIDIDEIPSNGPIYPAAVGTAINVGFDAAVFGHYVIIQHSNGYSTIYAHLQPNIMVNQGQNITDLNQPLGYQDNSGGASHGDHLHFGLAKGSAVSDFYISGPIEDPCAQMQNCSCQYSGQ